jgi:hypothetical protein
MKSDPRWFVIDSQQPSVAPRAVAPRRRQRLGLIAPPVFLGGVRKPEPISSPFHSNYVKSFAGCWWVGDRGTEKRFGGLTLLVTPGPAPKIDELPRNAEGAIGPGAARPMRKALTEIIDFIILTVNLSNLAIARLFFARSPRIASPRKAFCA